MRLSNLPGGLSHTLWLGAIALCVLLSVFSLFFAACSVAVPEAEETDGGFDISSDPAGGRDSGAAGEDESGEPENELPPVRLAETPDAGREYLNRITFLGDSTTYGIGYYYDRGYSDELCPPSQVWTPASGTLTLAYYDTATIVYPETGEEIGILDAVARAKPDILLITLGVNGVSFMTESDFFQVYTELVQKIQEASPNTKIILNSIYPVASNYQYIEQINNTKINAANAWIEQIAANTGVRYLYSFEAVVGEDGSLPAENQNGDGIHLNGDGFTKVMQYVRTHEYK